jgi:glucosamine-6-phosphate deaminase
VTWDRRLIRTAGIWLCHLTGKPILKLLLSDYVDHGLEDLVRQFGSANAVNIQVFNDLQHTITGWPGGKPNADDSTRPERALPFPKRVLIFSPHPDDDVISMGGTFARLVEQGHEVHVAYQTSGSIAVLDAFAAEMLDITSSIAGALGVDHAATDARLQQVLSLGENDGQPTEVLATKRMVREVEAATASGFLGVPKERIHFCRLPFYESGKVQKNPLSDADVQIVLKLLREVRPHQVYAAGDLADPHGTHEVALIAILKAYDLVMDDDWFAECKTWWYRGAWMEWGVDRVDMTVPLSPSEMTIKRLSIFRHQSQNNGPAFPGEDAREFWQRAEERNRHTASVYRKLGMAEYEAMECFAEYKHVKNGYKLLAQ